MSPHPAEHVAPAGLLALGFASFAWGFAEATYFFVVVDVLLTFIALRFGLRAGLSSALAAAVGATAGGAVMYAFAAGDAHAARAMIASVPFVSEAMITRGLAGIAAMDWPRAMLAGSVTGVPYRIYAVGAGERALPVALFLAVSIPVRLARFAIAATATWCVGRLLATRVRLRLRVVMLALFWIVFYGEFWLRWSGIEARISG